jgi:hypothetical protein
MRRRRARRWFALLGVTLAIGASARADTEHTTARSAGKRQQIVDLLSALSRQEQVTLVDAYGKALEMFAGTMKGPSESDAKVSAIKVTREIWKSVVTVSQELVPEQAKRVVAVITIVGEAGNLAGAIHDQVELAQAASSNLLLGRFLNELVAVSPPPPKETNLWVHEWNQDLARQTASGRSESAVLAEYEAAIRTLEGESRLNALELRMLFLLNFYEAWLNANYSEAKYAAGNQDGFGPILNTIEEIERMVRLELGDLPGPGKLLLVVHNDDVSLDSASVEPSTPLAEQAQDGLNSTLAQLGKFGFNVLDLCVHKRICFRRTVGPTFELDCGLVGPGNERIGGRAPVRNPNQIALGSVLKRFKLTRLKTPE